MAIEEKNIIELDSIDSTNNYAMQLIDGNKAQHGTTIVAKSQTAGKGQRGNQWMDMPNQSLLMSIIIAPQRPINSQIAFNAAIAVAITEVLTKLDINWVVRIKWPNDIIVNDKKAGGILIENVLRGTNWLYSVVGLGLNVNQVSFPQELPFATSLKMNSQTNFNITMLRDAIIEKVLNNTNIYHNENQLLETFNELLFRKGQTQVFLQNEKKWEATILQVKNDGTLEVQLSNGQLVTYRHGEVVWEY